MARTAISRADKTRVFHAKITKAVILPFLIFSSLYLCFDQLLSFYFLLHYNKFNVG